MTSKVYCLDNSIWRESTFIHVLYVLHYFSFPFFLLRFGAGGNASAHSATIMSARKLEEADDVSRIAKVDKSLSKAIMQARTAKKMTQKDLATAINEKPQVIGQYESGKAVPNPQIIAKLERKLGCKLPRPGKTSVPAAQ
jgi:putative transcription factor